MTCLWLGILSAFLVMFLNYVIGKPGSKEFSPYEIFSVYTVWLSRMKLKRLKLLDLYEAEYRTMLKSDSPQHAIYSYRVAHWKQLYEAAEQFFTWERALGMCSVCSGFWVSLGVAVAFSKSFYEVATIILISHVFIRLLNKLI